MWKKLNKGRLLLTIKYTFDMPKYRVIQWQKGLAVKMRTIEAENLDEAEEIAIPKITVEEIKNEDEN